MSIRRGVSLTELLVVMGTSTVALMAGTQMLRQAMTQQRYAEAECNVHRVAERLTVQFRRDVHAAESVERSETHGDIELKLQLPATSNDGVPTAVVYTVRDDEITRTATTQERPRGDDDKADRDNVDPNGIASVEIVHRESFRFGDDYAIDLRQLVSPDRVQLAVGQFRLPAAVRTKRADSRDNLQALVNVRAIVGKDHRFHRADSSAQGDES